MIAVFLVSFSLLLAGPIFVTAEIQTLGKIESSLIPDLNNDLNHDLNHNLKLGVNPNHNTSSSALDDLLLNSGFGDLTSSGVDLDFPEAAAKVDHFPEVTTKVSGGDAGVAAEVDGLMAQVQDIDLGLDLLICRQNWPKNWREPYELGTCVFQFFFPIAFVVRN